MNSKIFVNSNSKDGPISQKYMEAMASGYMLLTDKPHDADSFGLVHEGNCVFYYDTEDMKRKADYYLKHWEARARIASNGIRHVLENYTNSHQVKKMMEQIKYLLTRTKS